MKNITLLITAIFILSFSHTKAQCEAATEVGTSPIMVNNTGVSADAVALLSGEYVLITNTIPNDSYLITVTQNVINPGHEPYLTVRLASDNSVITSGYTPLQFVATSSMTEVHYHYDETCSLNLDLSILAFQNESTLSQPDIVLKPNVKLYPNPTKGQLNLESNIQLNNVEIYNVVGKQIAQIDLLDREEILDISNYSSGIYFLKFKYEGSSQTVKVVKQ